MIHSVTCPHTAVKTILLGERIVHGNLHALVGVLKGWVLTEVHTALVQDKKEGLQRNWMQDTASVGCAVTWTGEHMEGAQPATRMYLSSGCCTQSYRWMWSVSKCISASIQWLPDPKVIPSHEVLCDNKIRLTVLNLH